LRIHALIVCIPTCLLSARRDQGLGHDCLGVMSGRSRGRASPHVAMPIGCACEWHGARNVERCPLFQVRNSDTEFDPC
jgi:hypothetical protein